MGECTSCEQAATLSLCTMSSFSLDTREIWNHIIGWLAVNGRPMVMVPESAPATEGARQQGHDRAALRGLHLRAEVLVRVVDLDEEVDQPQ